MRPLLRTLSRTRAGRVALFSQTFGFPQRLPAQEAVATLDDAIAVASRISGTRPLVVHTSARTEGGTSYADLRSRMEAKGAPPMMILLGTGFGMAPEVASRADIVLAAIVGPGGSGPVHPRPRTSGSLRLDGASIGDAGRAARPSGEGL